MALNYVTLILDGFDGGGSILGHGTATFTPSVQLSDSIDQEWIPPAPVQAAFRAGLSAPQVRLLATDNANVLPAGWGWTVSFQNVPGSPSPFNFFLPFTGGATQRLSQLQPVQSVTALAAPAVPGIYVTPSGDTTGVTDTALIQALENLGSKKIYFSSGNFWTTGLTKKSGTYWEGAGVDATIIKLAAGANRDVIQGQNFTSLTLTGANTWGVSGIFDFGISGMTIDGNRAAQTGTSYGIRIYGYQWTFADLLVRNCYSRGIWTEWGPLQGDAPVTTAGSEPTAENVRVSWNGAHGWMHLGPSDARMHQVLCFKNNQDAAAAGIGFWAMQDQVSNICLTASAMNGTAASGFTGTFTVQPAALGNPTDLYAPSGALTVTTSSGTARMTYTGKTATTFTGCTVTSGSGTFQTGNQVTTSGPPLFTTNGLQLTACHSWANNHTWAAVFDGNVSDADCHWEGAQYGQLLIRNSSNKAGGAVYDYSTIPAAGGIQLGDAGSTPGVPQTASFKAGPCDIRTNAESFLNDTPARSSLNWVNCGQSSVDLLAVTEQAGTYATTIAAGSNGVDLSAFTGGSPGTLFTASTNQIPNGAGTLTIATAQGNQTATYTGTNGSNTYPRTAGTQFTGVVAAGGTPAGSIMSTGGAVSLAGIGSLAIGGTVNTGSRIRVHAQSSTTALSAGASLAQEYGPHQWDVGAAANAWRIKVNGTDQANFNGSNGQLQFPNGTDLRGYSDNYTTKTWEIAGSTGAASAKTIAATGLTGATAATRYAGATASGAPGSGAFLTGDFVTDQTGKIWLCTSGGSPGTWVSLIPWIQAHPAGFTPANPATTVSTSLVMMGIGSACQFTPTGSGKVLVNVTGVALTATGATNMFYGGRFGTVAGGVPANGDAATGTAFGVGGSTPKIQAAVTSAGIPFALAALVSLSAGTAYWFDLIAATANASDAATLTNISMTLAELP